VSREIGCQFSPATDRIVERRRIRAVVEAVWPNEKADALTAVICNCSVRTASRYLSGEIDAPAVLFAAIWNELTKHNS
jgi:hypothetical protein